MAAADEIDVYSDAARTAAAVKDHPAAAEHWLLAVGVARQVDLPPAEHVQMLQMAGRACARVDRLDEARELFDEAIVEAERRLGADAIEVAVALEARCSLGGRVRAGDIERLERAAAIRNAATRVDRVALAATYGRLGFAHNAGGFGPRSRGNAYLQLQIEQLIQCDPIDVDAIIFAYQSLTNATFGAERRHHATTVRGFVERQGGVTASQRVEVLAMVAATVPVDSAERRTVVDEAVGLLTTGEVSSRLCRAGVTFLRLLDTPRGTGFVSGPGRTIADRLLGELARRGPLTERDAGFLVREIAGQAETAGDDHAYLAYRKLLTDHPGDPDWRFENDEAIAVMSVYVGDLALADRLLAGVLTGRQSRFGAGHSFTRRALRNLAALRQLQGRADDAVAALLDAGVFDDGGWDEDPFALSIAAASALGDIGAHDRACAVLEQATAAVAAPPKGRPIAGDPEAHAVVRAVVARRGASDAALADLHRFAAARPGSPLRIPAGIALALHGATTGDRPGARTRLASLLADPACVDGRAGRLRTIAQAGFDAIEAGGDPPLVLWPAIPMCKEWRVRERTRWLARLAR